MPKRAKIKVTKKQKQQNQFLNIYEYKSISFVSNYTLSFFTPINKRIRLSFDPHPYPYPYSLLSEKVLIFDFEWTENHFRDNI